MFKAPGIKFSFKWLHIDIAMFNRVSLYGNYTLVDVEGSKDKA